MLKYIFILCVALGILIVAPQQAKAAWWEFLFPMLKKEEYNPYETLQAPFSKEAQNPDIEKISPEELANSIAKTPISKTPQDLSSVHRTVPEISKWVFSATSDIMNFTSGDYTAEMKQHRPYFDANGWDAYQKFLSDKKMKSILESGQYEIHSVVQGEPILLNRGVVNKRYRWLFESNIMVTYLKRGETDYKSAKPINQFYKLNTQVGRHQMYDAQNDHGLLIEGITGKEIKK